MKILVVAWNDRETSRYLLGKSTMAREHKESYIISAFEGTYTLNKKTKAVTLDTGISNCEIKVKSWTIENKED